MSIIPNTHIEMIREVANHVRPRFALLDFDGTISLIREGWQDVMIPMMVDILLKTPKAEDPLSLTLKVKEYVTRLTGRQTIYQMIQLADEIRQRGGEPLDPLVYKKMYHDKLMERIEGRLSALKRGLILPEDMMVPCSLEMLEELKHRGIRSYLASGTDEIYVHQEAALLGIVDYFEGIYGALDDYKRYSKRMVIQRIMHENGLNGPELATFGDGYVEIEDTRATGGIAIGVASNEAEHQGIDEWKRSRLIEAGADVIVPDFREHAELAALVLDR